MDAASVVDELKLNNCSTPTNESQCRELLCVPDDALPTVWQEVCVHAERDGSIQSKAMVRNWWYLGGELQRLHAAGLFGDGRPEKNATPGERFSLSEIGINFNQSSRCQQLVTGYSKAELDEWLGRY